MRPLLLRDEARKDLFEAFQWYEGRRAGLGSEFERAVSRTLAEIEDNPAQYPVSVADVRKAPLKRFPYVVYYVLLDEGTSVIAIMHSRRHPRTWQERQ